MSKLNDFVNAFRSGVAAEFETTAEEDIERMMDSDYIDSVDDLYYAVENDYDLHKGIRSIAWDVAIDLIKHDEEVCKEYVESVYDENPNLVIGVLDNLNIPYEISGGKITNGKIMDRIKAVAEEVMYEYDFGEPASFNDLQSEAQNIYIDVLTEIFENNY